MKRKKAWVLAVIVPSIVLILAAIAFAIFGLVIAALILLALSIILWTIAISTALKIVPENYEYVVELFGEYDDILDPGLRLISPFGIEKIRSRVFLGQQMMRLYLDEQVPGSFGGGDVEFINCSGVGVNAFFYFKIENSYKATYEVIDLFEAIEEKADGILRTNFMMYNLDEAMNLKGRFNLENIACFTDLRLGTTSPTLQNDFLNSEFYLGMKEFGVEPKSFVVSDFRLPQDVIDQRQKKLIADKDKEVAQVEYDKAEIEKKTMVVRAQAKKDSRVLEGDGEAHYIQRVLAAANLNSSQNAAYLTEMAKWKAISESKSGEKVILVEGSGEAGNGAKFGTGLSATR